MFIMKKHTFGFSIIEILIVVAVLGLLAVVGIRVLSNFKNTTNLSTSIENGVSSLVDARSKTLSSKNGNQHGVHFESGKLTFFVGTTYSASDPENEEVLLPSVVEISTISLNGGGSDIIFKKLTGDTDQYGSVTFRIKDQVSQTRTISVPITGIPTVQ